MPDYPELQLVSAQKRKRVLKREGMLRSMIVVRTCLRPKEKKGLKKRRYVEKYVWRQIILHVYARYARYTRCSPYISDVEWQVYSESPAGPESCRVPCWAKPPPMNVLTGGHCLWQCQHQSSYSGLCVCMWTGQPAQPTWAIPLSGIASAAVRCTCCCITSALYIQMFSRMFCKYSIFRYLNNFP